MTMKIKKHIKAKRQYVSPSIYVKVLQMESMLAAVTIIGGGPDITPGDKEPFDPNNPFGKQAKAANEIIDDEME